MNDFIMVVAENLIGVGKSKMCESKSDETVWHGKGKGFSP